MHDVGRGQSETVRRQVCLTQTSRLMEASLPWGLILASQEEPGMWDFFRRFPWVLDPYRYRSLDEVRASLEDKIIAPAVLKAEELAQ